jgi:hypothetical protein
VDNPTSETILSKNTFARQADPSKSSHNWFDLSVSSRSFGEPSLLDPLTLMSFAWPSGTPFSPAGGCERRGHKGAEGEYNFDEFGDGLHGFNIVRNEKGTIVFDKHIEFTD